MGEDVATQIGNDPFTQPIHEIEPGGDRGSQNGADQNQHGEVLVNEISAFRVEAVVDHAAHGEWHRQHRNGRDHERDKRGRHHARVLEQIRLQRDQRFQRCHAPRG